jgi:hypothetical protein
MCHNQNAVAFVHSSCSICGTRDVTLVINLMINHDWRKARIVITTNRTYISMVTCDTNSFGHCVVHPSSIYRFWLPLWYLQTLLICSELLQLRFRQIKPSRNWYKLFDQPGVLSAKVQFLVLFYFILTCLLNSIVI